MLVQVLFPDSSTENGYSLIEYNVNNEDEYYNSNLKMGFGFVICLRDDVGALVSFGIKRNNKILYVPGNETIDLFPDKFGVQEFLSIEVSRSWYFFNQHELLSSLKRCKSVSSYASVIAYQAMENELLKIISRNGNLAVILKSYQYKTQENILIEAALNLFDIEDLKREMPPMEVCLSVVLKVYVDYAKSH